MDTSSEMVINILLLFLFNVLGVRTSVIGLRDLERGRALVHPRLFIRGSHFFYCRNPDDFLEARKWKEVTKPA